MDEAAQARLIELKRKLEAFDYHEKLHVESAGLVERLVGDLFQTTMAYKKLLETHQALEQDYVETQRELAFQKKENKRLLRFNKDETSEEVETASEFKAFSGSRVVDRLREQVDFLNLELGKLTEALRVSEESRLGQQRQLERLREGRKEA